MLINIARLKDVKIILLISKLVTQTFAWLGVIVIDCVWSIEVIRNKCWQDSVEFVVKICVMD